MGSVAHPGCLDPPGEEPCVEDDEIELTVEGDALHLAHWNTKYNCCLDDIVVSLTVEGTLLSLTEHEVLTVRCDCMCCYKGALLEPSPPFRRPPACLVETRMPGDRIGPTLTFEHDPTHSGACALCR